MLAIATEELRQHQYTANKEGNIKGDDCFVLENSVFPGKLNGDLDQV